MKKSGVIVLALLLALASVAAYEIDFTPTEVIARDNPFAQYDGDLPAPMVKVTENGLPAKDVTITLTITHVDNLILPSGFPWYEGAEVLHVTQLEEDGTLEVDALLFPLRGKYTVDVTVMDAEGKTETEQFMIKAAEPFKQSTLNAIFFLGALVIFGAVVGWVFGKDFKKKGQGKASLVLAVLMITVLLIPVALAHGEEEEEGHHDSFVEDERITYKTIPATPEIGKETSFTFTVRDVDGIVVDNAKAHILIANEEEGFDVLEMDLFSQTGTFTVDYGVFDGAPHFVEIHVEPTAQSSKQFAPVERDFHLAAEAFDPPLSSLIIAGLVMLVAMLLGFVIGVGLRKGGSDE